MKRLLFLLALPAAAHTISMSTGTLTLRGMTADYELRMPLYEAAHIPKPDQIFREYLTLRGASLESQVCRETDQDLVCTAKFRFPSVPDVVTVDCRLARITVPNHVHLLRAKRESGTDQAMFDVTFETASLRFRPLKGWERNVREAGAGAIRIFTSLAGVLVLLGIALAAPDLRSLAKLFGAFVIGVVFGMVGANLAGWYPHPRFVEAALALTIAYLAVELLFLPPGLARWIAIAVLGVFHGVWFLMFVRAGEFHAAWAALGMAPAAALIACLLWFLTIGARRYGKRLHADTVLAGVLLVIGAGWFTLRLFS